MAGQDDGGTQMLPVLVPMQQEATLSERPSSSTGLARTSGAGHRVRHNRNMSNMSNYSNFSMESVDEVGACSTAFPRTGHNRNMSNMSNYSNFSLESVDEAGARSTGGAFSRTCSGGAITGSKGAGLRVRHTRNASNCSNFSIYSDDSNAVGDSMSAVLSVCDWQALSAIASQHDRHQPSSVDGDEGAHTHAHSCTAHDTTLATEAAMEKGVAEGCGGERESQDEQKVDEAVKVSCWKSERNVTMGLLLTITCFLFMDQNLMAPNLTDIARSFNMTDIQRDTKLGGEISLSLFLVGAPVSLVVGYHADRVNRKILYSTVVLFGETGCLLTAFVEEYWHLFVLRALTGVALGGALPLIYSMLADMYPAPERPRASAFVGLTMGLGVGSGQMLAAVVGSTHGWRAPFVIVAAPCLVVLALFMYFSTEPKRGSQEVGYEEMQQVEMQEAELQAKMSASKKELSLDSSSHEQQIVQDGPKEPIAQGRRRDGPAGLPLVVRGRVARHEDADEEGAHETVQGIEHKTAAGIGKSFENSMQRSQATSDVGDLSRIWDFVRLFRRPSNVLLFLQGIPGCMPWGVIGVFLNDYFIADRNAPSKVGAFAVCAAYGMGSVFGQIAGGFLGKKLYQMKHEYLCYLLGTVQILSSGPLLLMLNLPFDFRSLVPIAVLGGIFSGYASPNVKAVLLNVNTPDTRGSAMALFSLSDDIGKGLGPPLVGILIINFGRRMAFSIAACMWFFSGLLLLALSRTIVADEQDVALQVANQQQARLVYLGRGNTSVHVQDTTAEAGSAGSAVHGGEEEREEKMEEERGGGLVSASGGADVSVAVAFRETTHDAALGFRVV